MLPEALSACLPPEGFVRSYCSYSSGATDAPEVYHAGVALAILAGAVADKLAFPLIGDSVSYPNLWTVLVGPSRAARKTTAIDIGASILGEAQGQRILPDAGSFEQFVEEMQIQPCGLIVHREFAHFLKTTERGYAAPLRTLLMDLHDCPTRPFTRVLKKKRVVIEPPIVLSMLAGVATPLLCAYTDELDWTGGFLPRCMLVYAERDRLALPEGNPTWRSALVGALRLAANSPVPPCGGLAPGARAMLFAWQQSLESSAPRQEPYWSFYSALPALAAKIAVLFAYDMGAQAAGPGWLVDQWFVWLSTKLLCEQYVPRLLSLFARVTRNPFERLRQRALDAIRDGGSAGRRKGEVLRHVGCQPREFDEVITAVKEESLVVERRNTHGVLYVLREWAGDAPATPPPNGTAYASFGAAESAPPPSGAAGADGFPLP